MTRFYDFLSKLSGCLALVCAILAVLATPSSARADDLSYCESVCSAYQNQDYSLCVGDCMNNSFGVCPQSTCSNTCAGSKPKCGTGTCDKVQACVDAKCACKPTDDYQFCECQAP